MTKSIFIPTKMNLDLIVPELSLLLKDGAMELTSASILDSMFDDQSEFNKYNPIELCEELFPHNLANGLTLTVSLSHCLILKETSTNFMVSKLPKLLYVHEVQHYLFNSLKLKWFPFLGAKGQPVL